MKNKKTHKIAYAGLMAALCYVGYAVFPAISATGTKVHIGNAFVVLGALLLGGWYGGLAGAIGLALADILGGYVESSPRTFICKLLIGLIVGLIAHKFAHLSDDGIKKSYVIKWTIFATLGGLLFNCIFEPSLKYVWYTLLTPNAEKAQSAINALMAITTYATLVNALINSVIAIIIYLALRGPLKKASII